MFGFDFQFEQISFWLGFAAATLFWWLISTLIKSWPKVKGFISQQREIEKQRRIAGLDAQIREKMLQRAQKLHLASALFPLDDILVTPTLVAPPRSTDPEKPEDHQPLISRVIPYAPHWPEMASNLCAPTLSLLDALQNKADIAIIGQPGSGKTVALAHLVSVIARRTSSSAVGTNSTPFLIHVNDLRADISEKRAPLDTVIKTICRDFPVTLQRQIGQFIEDILENDHFLLIIDGLDEYAPDEVPFISQFLKSLKINHPRIHLILAASPDYLDGMVELGLIPLALTTWGPEQVKEFVERWGKSWRTAIHPVIEKQTGQAAVHPYLLNQWVQSAQLFLTPLEWTARVWSLYAGDVRGPQSMLALEAMHIRLAGKNIAPEALSALANLMVNANKSSVQYSEAEKYLSRYRLIDVDTPSAQVQQPGQPPDAAVQLTPKTPTTKTKKLTSSGAQILNQLINSGLLCEYYDGSVAFISPIITGYFSTLTAQPQVNIKWPAGPTWSTRLTQYQYLTAQDLTTDSITELLKTDSGPFFPNTQLVIRWLKDAPANSESRTMVMRKFVQLLQFSDIPLGVRACLMSGAATSNDPAVASLCRQFLASPDAQTRLLAAIGAGITRDSKSIDPLTSLFADPDESVQFAACYSLASIATTDAWEAINSAFHYGDEGLRLAVGEALAGRGAEGHKLLKESVHSEDILVRRASVFGIARIMEPWAASVLEKIAVEDGQWVVRNAAGQALENLNHPQALLPKQATPAHEAPWLINYASKMGEGVAPNQSVKPMLMHALRNGSDEQKIAALEYLVALPDDDLLQELITLCQSPHMNLQSAGLYAIWVLLASGLKLPGSGYKNY